MEKEDDMEIFAQIIPINSRPANVKSVMQMLMNFACCKVFEGIKLNVSRTDTKSLWLHCHYEFRAFIFNYPSTMEAHEFVLAAFPDKTWPPNFANFCLNQMFNQDSQQSDDEEDQRCRQDVRGLAQSSYDGKHHRRPSK